ncbi:MAG: MFS transporter [Chloroflexota bacterium]
MAQSEQRRLFLARIAVSVTFFTVGAIFANWVARIPDVKETLNLSESLLGLALMVSSFGVIFGLLITGKLIARFGSKAVSFYCAIGLALSLAVVSFSTNLLTLSASLFFLGFFNSTTDVAMNAQGVEVERRYGKPIMNSFHAFWSVGLTTGALMGSGFAGANISFQQHFLIVPVLFILLMIIVRGWLLIIDGEQDTADTEPTFQLPPRALWGLGALAFAAGLSEGALIDWSALYLTDIVGTSEALAAFGLAAFSASMVVMRFAGDTVTERLGAVRVVRAGGIAVVLGVGVALLVPNVWTTIIGFMVAGLGLAVAIPLAFSAAGKLPNIPPGRGIAGVATIGYAAFLVGPPVIGFIADATNLRLSFIVVMCLAGTMVYSANALKVGKSKVKA